MYKRQVLCFTGHKALLGPQGTGGLYVRPGLSIQPLVAVSYTHLDVYKRQMLCLALQAAPAAGQRPVLLAARNAHKALLYAAALLDFDIQWLSLIHI